MTAPAPPASPPAAGQLLRPFCLPRAQLVAHLEEVSITVGRLASLLLAHMDGLLLAWRQLAGVAFDSGRGCLLLDFLDLGLGLKLQVKVGVGLGVCAHVLLLWGDMLGWVQGPAFGSTPALLRRLAAMVHV